jgi:hypothetical protein
MLVALLPVGCCPALTIYLLLQVLVSVFTTDARSLVRSMITGQRKLHAEPTRAAAGSCCDSEVIIVCDSHRSSFAFTDK